MNLREAANGQSCIKCGAANGTTVLCHYSGPFQHRFGKGRAIKGNDAAGADLCDECHKYFDEYKSVTASKNDKEAYQLQRVERSEHFLALCMLTVIRRIQQGALIIKGESNER